MRHDLPSGTVTFLFTDVEGSTRLLHELGAEAYAEALAEHRRVIREACALEGGVEVDTQGDAFFFAYPSAPGAAAAATAFTQELRSGPICVRVGLHTGQPLLGAEGYVGDDVHFAARVASSAHGGQIICSQATAELIARSDTVSQGVLLVSLGSHRLKDISEPVSIYQLGDGSFPPLKTIANSNLPTPASSFLGREDELYEADALLQQTRLLTIAGPGGQGKTRFALELATRAREERFSDYPDGVFASFLASLRDPTLVLPRIAQTLNVKEQPGTSALDALASHLQAKKMLLLVDNAEHLLDAAPELSQLLQQAPGLTLLVTSRELLRIQGETPYSLPPLQEDEGIALFCERARLEPSPEIAELCSRLEGLPLAIELAAARTAILTPAQLLERLSQRLDLLKGGRDADPRQQTLRATIEWSYDLLSPDEQRLFRALSVFQGGCTLEAAEEVAGADLDSLQGLCDKSLLRFSDERFWMLETIREYAGEQLERERAAQELAQRHVAFFSALAAEQRAILDAGDPEEGPVSVLAADLDNLRAAVDFALEVGERDAVRGITTALPMFWIMRGLYSEGRAWLERAVALDEAPDETRRRLLSALAMLAYEQRDYPAATAASDEAAALAADLGGATERLALLREQAFAALMNGELEKAEQLFDARLHAAIAADNGVATSSCRLNLVSIANKTGRHLRAEQLLSENLPFVRSKGQARCEAYTLAGYAETAFHAGRPRDGTAEAELSATRALQIDDKPLAVYCLELLAAAATARGDERRAATLLGAAEAAREGMGVELGEDEEAVHGYTLGSLDGDSELVAEAWAEGRTLDLVGAVELASID